MLLRETVKIGENETAGELFDRLAPIGAQLLLKTLEGLEQGSIAPQKQNDQESTYASMLDKNLSAVNWNKSSREVHNLIRGLTPWPTAYTVLEGKKLKLFGSSVSAAKGGAGEIVSLNHFSGVRRRRVCADRPGAAGRQKTHGRCRLFQRPSQCR